MLLDPHTLSPAPIGHAIAKLFRSPVSEAATKTSMETKSASETTKPHPKHPMRVRRTTADRLRDALLKLSGSHATCIKHEEKAWSSITFSGTRHEITLRFEGAQAVAHGEELMECLPEHEFAIPGQLVADATITEVDHRFGLHERLEIKAVLLLLEEN